MELELFNNVLYLYYILFALHLLMWQFNNYSQIYNFVYFPVKRNVTLHKLALDSKGVICIYSEDPMQGESYVNINTMNIRHEGANENQT